MYGLCADEADRFWGTITDIEGPKVYAQGLPRAVSVGQLCHLYRKHGDVIRGEIVGFQKGYAIIMISGDSHHLSPGGRVEIVGSLSHVYPSLGWRGRVINAYAQPLDEKGTLPQGVEDYVLTAPPPPACQRQPLGPQWDCGVRAINTFLTCRRGQRMGIFAGSGVGKSTLLSMLVEHSVCDVVVIGLIGERGREVREFIEKRKKSRSMEKTVIIAATSDEPAFSRKRAAHLTMTVAEFFRDQGMNVLCVIDNMTRVAMALREVGLLAGEDAAWGGYPPSVFAELPKLIERAGPGRPHQGMITSFLTVLVEGDDHNEPMTDTLRGLLDGHCFLDRSIADRGRYPAINIFKSVSRTCKDLQTREQKRVVQKAKESMLLYEDMIDAIRLGIYKKGQDAMLDRAVDLYPKLENFLQQHHHEKWNFEEGFQALNQLMKDVS